MKLSARIKLLFVSTKCDVRGYHECSKGDWQPAKEYGRDFFRLSCDGCFKTLITVIRDPVKPMERIVLTRWWGDVYPASMYEKSLTATAGKTVTTSSNDQTWTFSVPVSMEKNAAKKNTRKKVKARK